MYSIPETYIYNILYVYGTPTGCVNICIYIKHTSEISFHKLCVGANPHTKNHCMNYILNRHTKTGKQNDLTSWWLNQPI